MSETKNKIWKQDGSYSNPHAVKYYAVAEGDDRICYRSQRWSNGRHGPVGHGYDQPTGLGGTPIDEQVKVADASEFDD